MVEVYGLLWVSGEVVTTGCMGFFEVLSGTASGSMACHGRF